MRESISVYLVVAFAALMACLLLVSKEGGPANRATFLLFYFLRPTSSLGPTSTRRDQGRQDLAGTDL